MDLQDQLKNLFPDHIPLPEAEKEIEDKELWIQDDPMICKFEKRKGKPTTKELQTKLSVGGSYKDDSIIIQGDYRDKIMTILKEKGFKVKRVGG
jgi:translation initiation factor 1